jgi:hypothetical protein
MAHEAGKGSAPRPFSVSQEEWSTRWDVIFGRDKIAKEQEQETKPKEDSKQEENN